MCVYIFCDCTRRFQQPAQDLQNKGGRCSIYAKEWLERGRDIAAELDKLINYRRTLVDNAERVTKTYGAEAVTFSQDPHKFDKLAECDEAINRLNEELLETCSEILRVIFMIPDTSLRTLLLSRYINFNSWAKVAADMGKSRRYVYNLIDEAISAVDLILDAQNH